MPRARHSPHPVELKKKMSRARPQYRNPRASVIHSGSSREPGSRKAGVPLRMPPVSAIKYPPAKGCDDVLTQWCTDHCDVSAPAQQWHAHVACHPTCKPKLSRFQGRTFRNYLYEDWHCYAVGALDDTTGLNVTHASEPCSLERSNITQRDTRRLLEQMRDACVAQRTCPTATATVEALACKCRNNRPLVVSRRSEGHQSWEVGARCLAAHPGLTAKVSPMMRAAKAAGRIVFLCADDEGLGAYFKTLVAAFAFSLLTERALVLHCPAQVPSHRVPDGRVPEGAVKLARHLHFYFRSDFFDWTWPHGLHPSWSKRSIVDLKDASSWALAYNGSFLADEPGIILVGNEHSGLDKLMRHEANRRSIEATFAAPADLGDWKHGRPVTAESRDRYDAWYQLMCGCTLRFLLGPQRRLLDLEERLVRAYDVPRATDSGLLDVVALHLRLGDGWMTEADSSTWYAANEFHADDFVRNPSSFLRGLAAASGTQEGCRGCLMVADADWAAAKAAELYPNIAFTGRVSGGRPVHFGATPNISQHDVDRLFLDWWALARSVSAASRHSGSAFLWSALPHREAGLPHGFLHQDEPRVHRLEHCAALDVEDSQSNNRTRKT